MAMLMGREIWGQEKKEIGYKQGKRNDTWRLGVERYTLQWTPKTSDRSLWTFRTTGIDALP